ncbi:MAG: HAMP domain-containing histidine kinase [Omnitrophica bacterium]|nr:HAMP domain-containing histidine kinase [Candidatus Omnitrophota bacterium]
MAEVTLRREKTTNFKRPGSIVGEFLRALEKGHTYNIRKNSYLIFGILWGIPVPIVTIGMALYYKDIAPSVTHIIGEVIANPIHIFFLLHPMLFGIVFGAMGTVRDEKEKEKQELYRLKDNFLSMVSHELRSPLTAVQGYVTFIMDGKAGPVTGKQKEALGIASEQVEHLDYLIEELVDLSRIETGEFEVKPGCVDIKGVATKVVNSLKQRADEKNITLKNELPDQIPCVWADEKRMSQVLANLLGNAIKFTPENRTVRITGREKYDTVEFSVVDQGIGIPNDKIDKIFERFYQVDSTNRRKFGGCGLGLAITKNIIELHKGRLYVESEIGVGSKFFFELKKCERERGEKCK